MTISPKWARLDSDQQPTPYEGAALPLSYRPKSRNECKGLRTELQFTHSLLSSHGLALSESGRRESDPPNRLGRPVHYHYATPATQSWVMSVED